MYLQARFNQIPPVVVFIRKRRLGSEEVKHRKRMMESRKDTWNSFANSAFLVTGINYLHYGVMHEPSYVIVRGDREAEFPGIKV